MMNLKLGRRLRIQTQRTDKRFQWEWIPDMISDELMVASITLFGVSLVYLGTAA